MVTCLFRLGGCRVDGINDALGAVEFGLEAGSLGGPGAAERADEGGGAGDGVCPDGPVAGVMGGLRAACRVAHSSQGLVGGGGSGHLQAERAGGVGEPAVVRRGEVQYPGALAEQVEDVLVAGDDARGGRVVSGQVCVDVAKNPVSSRAPGPAGMMPFW
jgi:hypothetical protein